MKELTTLQKLEVVTLLAQSEVRTSTDSRQHPATFTVQCLSDKGHSLLGKGDTLENAIENLYAAAISSQKQRLAEATERLEAERNLMSVLVGAP